MLHEVPCGRATSASAGSATGVAGHDALRSLDLPLANLTPDEDIIELATREARVVVTKDTDFVTSFLLRRLPQKLLLISTGNISNDALARLINANLPALQSALADHDLLHNNSFLSEFSF